MKRSNNVCRRSSWLRVLASGLALGSSLLFLGCAGETDSSDRPSDAEKAPAPSVGTIGVVPFPSNPHAQVEAEGAGPTDSKELAAPSATGTADSDGPGPYPSLSAVSPTSAIEPGATPFPSVVANPVTE